MAQGRVWTGTEALKQGLVDKLGGFDVAVDSAKARAHIAKGQEVTLVVLPARRGWFETFMERQEDDPEGAASAQLLLRGLPKDARSLIEAAASLSDRGPIARLPFALRFR